MQSSDPKQTSFDVLCHLTLDEILGLDSSRLKSLQKQANREIQRACLAQAAITLALSLIDLAREYDDAEQG